jgi:hypothetical protein
MTTPSKEKFELPRNATGLKYQLISTVIGFSIFYFFVIWLIRRPFKWFDAEPFLGWFAILLIYAFLMIFTIIAMQRSWSKRSYYLRGNMIVVAQKNPWTGAVDESIYRLDTVISANVKQTVLGKRNNYGDIILSVPKTGDNSRIVLKDIENPRETVIKINNIVDKSGSSGIAMTT